MGGIGSIPGIVLGAFALIGLPELLREFAEYRLLLYGALLIIIAGFVQIGEYALYIAIDFLNYGYTGIWMVIWLSTGVVAVIFGFLLLFFFLALFPMLFFNCYAILIFY